MARKIILVRHGQAYNSVDHDGQRIVQDDANARAATQEDLQKWLADTRLAGDVATDRSSNINNLRGLARRNPYYMFGLDLDGHWDEEALLELMHQKVGISPDPNFIEGQDTIDPALTVRALTRFARAFAQTIDKGGSILFATGHPAGLGALHTCLADFARGHGANVLELHELLPHAHYPQDLPDEGGDVRQLNSVCMRYRGGNLLHTHSSADGEQLLDALERVGVVPDLVVADHGWAGAAGARGICAIGFADCNDPALFVGEAQGDIVAAVPIDDGLHADLYEPVASYIEEEARRYLG